MFRIDTDGHVNGRFVTGNPQSGQKATRMGAEWPNAVQEEICKVIEASNIALDKTKTDQLFQAIVAIATGAAGAGGGSVPTTRQIIGTGIFAGQGGPLVANLSFGQPAAAPADVLAGTDNAKPLTSLSVAGAFGRSLTPNGYALIPFGGGLMLQWMAASIGANRSAIFNLPTSFPNACFGAWVTGGVAQAGVQDNNPFVSGYGVSNVSVYSATASSVGINILAIGY
jgi:hypothetical protein